jgi:hypothetical protein
MEADPRTFENEGVQVAVYTSDSKGHLTTKSTRSNMPQSMLADARDMKMSPSGKLLAVSGYRRIADIRVPRERSGDALHGTPWELGDRPDVLGQRESSVRDQRRFWRPIVRVYCDARGSEAGSGFATLASISAESDCSATGQAVVLKRAGSRTFLVASRLSLL